MLGPKRSITIQMCTPFVNIDSINSSTQRSTKNSKKVGKTQSV